MGDKRTGKKEKQKKAPKVDEAVSISEKPPLASPNQKKSPKKK